MWLEIEHQNLLQVKAGIYSFRMPDSYETNSTDFSAWSIQGVAHAPHSLLRQSIDHLKGVLSWLNSQFSAKGDFLGAVLGAMLLRHLGDDHPDAYLQRDINSTVGHHRYLFAGVDELKNVIEQKIVKGS
jgi:hypothetical protein